MELARIEQVPSGDGWLEVAVTPDPQAGAPVYRFVKIESAKGAGLALAEIEFYSPAGRLSGSGFGTSVGNKSAATFDKALDGDPKTFFESTAGNSYVGIDLGGQVQAPAPRFSPEGGAFAAPQKIKIDTWPSGTTIRYTTDGSAPSTSNGEVYRQPITVAGNTSIAAIASRVGLADSNVAIATYRIGAAATATRQVKSYHLGNSLTDTVNGFLQPIADSGGKNLLFMRKSVPGCSIGFHWEHNRAGLRLAGLVGQRLQHGLREEGGPLVPATVPQSAGPGRRRQVRRQVHRADAEIQSGRRRVAVCPMAGADQQLEVRRALLGRRLDEAALVPAQPQAGQLGGGLGQQDGVLPRPEEDLGQADRGPQREARPPLSGRAGAGAAQEGDRGRQGAGHEHLLRHDFLRRHSPQRRRGVTSWRWSTMPASSARTRRAR